MWSMFSGLGRLAVQGQEAWFEQKFKYNYLLASQDALEVMGVTHSLTDWVHKR